MTCFVSVPSRKGTTGTTSSRFKLLLHTLPVGRGLSSPIHCCVITLISDRMEYHNAMPYCKNDQKGCFPTFLLGNSIMQYNSCVSVVKYTGMNPSWNQVQNRLFLYLPDIQAKCSFLLASWTMLEMIPLFYILCLTAWKPSVGHLWHEQGHLWGPVFMNLFNLTSQSGSV